MRKVIQVACAADNSIYVVCADGTLWHSKPWESGAPQWTVVQCPPEGTVGREPKTLDDVAEHLRKKSRGMIIGRGKKK